MTFGSGQKREVKTRHEEQRELARRILACTKCTDKKIKYAINSLQCNMCLDLIIHAVVGSEMIRRGYLTKEGFLHAERIEICPRCHFEPVNILICMDTDIDRCPVPHSEDTYHLFCPSCKHEWFTMP